MSIHPNQPTEMVGGVLRFKKNKIVEFLLDAGPFDLNQLACMNFDDDEHAHFNQLHGYSVSGWGGLSTTSDARRESVPEYGCDIKSYQEGFDEGLAHAVELLERHIEGFYDG